MKKLIPIILSAVILAGCSGNSDGGDISDSVTSETTVTTTVSETETEKVSETTTETTAEVTAGTAEYSQNIQDMAHTFAKLVYEELENNKTAEKPTSFHPISASHEIPETGFDPDAFEADIFFIDTDLDGVPELFTGSHGTMGSGRYTVYTADGGSYGNGIFAHYFDGYCIVDGCMYASSGSTTFFGWTKLCDNLPTIYCNGFLSDKKPNNMTLRYADGSEENFDGLTYDEVMDLYRNYLNVEFDELKFTDRDEDIPFTYSRGLLEVPDADNYTEEDIYNCLAELLAKYEKSAGTIPSVTEEKTPINAELCINADGTLNEPFTEIITKLAEQNKPDHGLVYPALWDFDGDEVPEIILTHHNSGQGLMPSYVYSAISLEQIGEFKGFCRDGFTRFVNTGGSTVIYNYYEHSIQIRYESAEKVILKKGGRLVSESETVREWVLSNTPPALKFSEEYSNTEEPSYSAMTADCYQGNVCTSYSHNADGDAEGLSENAVESYNNYIRSRALLKNDIDRLLICGSKNQYAFFQTEEGCFFIDENGEKTLLKEGWAYFDLYTLWDSIIVCQPLGAQPCDIYIIKDGKPVLDEKLSGHGMYFDYSHFYNEGYELTHSTYDGLVDKNGKPMGTHTFKKYQFYPTIDGWREYGSIVVPMDEFMEVYGDDIKPIAEELAENDTEIHEVLYRGDRCFILNCRRTIFLDEEKTQPAGAYYTTNITLKPLYDGGFSELCRDKGVYKTALIPEIAVYPEKMYIPEEN